MLPCGIFHKEIFAAHNIYFCDAVLDFYNALNLLQLSNFCSLLIYNGTVYNTKKFPISSAILSFARSKASLRVHYLHVEQRRYTAGRNKQINIKATDETIQRVYRLVDEEHVPLGELLELALNALENAP